MKALELQATSSLHLPNKLNSPRGCSLLGHEEILSLVRAPLDHVVGDDSFHLGNQRKLIALVGSGEKRLSRVHLEEDQTE